MLAPDLGFLFSPFALFHFALCLILSRLRRHDSVTAVRDSHCALHVVVHGALARSAADTVHRRVRKGSNLANSKASRLFAAIGKTCSHAALRTERVPSDHGTGEVLAVQLNEITRSRPIIAKSHCSNNQHLALHQIPFNLLVALGSYCLFELGWGILTFGDCQEAQRELMQVRDSISIVL